MLKNRKSFRINKLTGSNQESSLGKNPFLNSLDMKATGLYLREYVNSSCGIKLPKKALLDQTPATKIFGTAELRQRAINLSNSGLRLLIWFVYHAVPGQDYIKFNQDAYMQETDTTSVTTVRAGLENLKRYEFIADTHKKGVYWINPLCFFRGDRLKTFPKNVRLIHELTSL